MARFTIPRDVYYGPSAIDELSKMTQFKKAMIVTGGHSMKKGGFLDKTENALKAAGMEVEIFDGVEPDPSIETVQKGAAAMLEFEPDIIVSIGGGSPMDAAKIMWVFYEYPDCTFEDIKNPFTVPKLRNKAVFAAIPSTSGTASEVTAFSVITDYSTHIKYPIADFEITPDIAILDTDIPLTMPKTLTAHTGMDALTHSLEAFVSRFRTAITDGLALQAISDIYDSLMDSYNGDKEARTQMHIAQCLAGMSFSNALLGIAHSLAHKTGAEFSIPHGCCNAILLPMIIQYNSKEASAMVQYAKVARMLGLPGGDDKQLVNNLIESIRDFNKKLNIAPTYKDNGVEEDHFLQKVDEIAANALADPCSGSNPRKPSTEDLKKILVAAFYGEDVNF